MFTRIMVPTDGGAASIGAVDEAIAAARATGAQIVGLHVPPLGAFGSRVAGTLAAPESTR